MKKLTTELEVDMKKKQLTFRQKRVGQVQIINSGIQRPGGEAKKILLKTRMYHLHGVWHVHPGSLAFSNLLKTFWK